MNIFQKIKLATTLNSDFNQFQQGVKMKNQTKIVAALTAAFTTVMAIPGVQTAVKNVALSLVSGHPWLTTLGAALTFIGALFHNPKAAQ